MIRFLVVTLALFTLPAGARDLAPYRLDQAEELRLAATAAPATVTADAHYYVLAADGFERVRMGSNGWHCFVERAFFHPDKNDPERYDPRIRAPHCINDAGAESRMRQLFMEAKLAAEGLSKDETRAKVNAAYASGELKPPARLAMTYMMSQEQWLGEDVGHWHPHLMFWLPYLENSATGDNPMLQSMPFVIDSGQRSAVLIVPVSLSSDDGGE